MDGTTNKVNTVPINIPVTSTMPMLLREPAPGPRANTNGKWPAIVATDVIIIGRNRVPAASMTASILDLPDICSVLANSTMRIPFFETSPTRVIKPIWL